MEKEYIVYLLRHKNIPEYTKIGYTGDLQNRIKSLQTASPTGIEVIKTYKFPKRRAEQLEQGLHTMAGLLNSHVSRNVGLNITNPEQDNKFIFWKASIGAIISIVFIYIGTYFGLSWLPASIYVGIISPVIWLFLPIEVITKLRYYMWLSISRSYRHDLNAKAQLIYAIPTAVLTPILLWLFLHYLHLSFEFIFAVGAIVGFVQWICAEIYFKKHM